MAAGRTSYEAMFLSGCADTRSLRSVSAIGIIDSLQPPHCTISSGKQTSPETTIQTDQTPHSRTGLSQRHSRKGLPAIPAKLPVIPRHSRKTPRHSRGQNSPSFPPSITEQPILNELARCGLLYAFPRGSVGTRKVSPPFPQNSPPFLQNSPSFPRRRESITEQPILNELARCGLLYAFPRGSVGTRKNKAPTGGAIISACPCCSCYFSRQAILGSQAVLDLRIHPGIGTELLPFNLVKTFYMPIVAIRLISWR